jgi:hypothetical protein
VQSYLPIPPVKRVTFADIKVGKVYYVKHSKTPIWMHMGRWGEELWLVPVTSKTSQRVEASSVRDFTEFGWVPRGMLVATPDEIDNSDRNKDWYHFYAPQEPVGDPTAASVAAAVPVGGAGAPSAAAADNTAGDPVAPRRLPSRKRKSRSSRSRKHRRPLKSRK